jgi:hypothetical protein
MRQDAAQGVVGMGNADELQNRFAQDVEDTLGVEIQDPGTGRLKGSDADATRESTPEESAPDPAEQAGPAAEPIPDQEEAVETAVGFTGLAVQSDLEEQKAGHNRSILWWGILAIIILALLILAIALFMRGGVKSMGSLAGGSKPSDRGGRALAAAQVQMDKVDPQAVPMLVGSSGVALAPPPEQWSIGFIAPSTHKIYMVDVSHADADAPKELGTAAKITDAEIASAIKYDSLKVGSDEAYAKAKAELAKTGPVPPQATESVMLVKNSALPQFTPGVWEINFLKGTSTEGMRSAEVDGMTGKVTETTKK